MISLDKIGPAEWPGDKGKDGRKTAGRAERCVSGGRGLQLNVDAPHELNLSPVPFLRDDPTYERERCTAFDGERDR